LNAAPHLAASALRRIVAAVVLVPLALAIVAFAVANRQPVTISLDPFASGPDTAAFAIRPLPLFVVLMGVLILGVLIGGLAGWLRHGGWRRTAKRLEREAAQLRAELAAHRRAAGARTATGVSAAGQPERLQLRAPVR